MLRKEIVYNYIDDERVPIQRLTVLDQIRTLIKKVTSSSDSHLKGNKALLDKVSELEANLNEFLEQATKRLREGKEGYVKMEIDSMFKPVFDKVITSSRWTNYYNIKVEKPKTNLDISFLYIVEMELKSKGG